MASNLSVGSGVIVSFFSLAHLTASARFAPGHQARYPAGYPVRPPGGGGHRVPVSRRVSAAGVRFSVILFPPGSWALLAVGLPDETCRPDPDGVTAFRTHELRPGWVPPLPRGRRCSPGQVVSLTGACRSAAASPYTPPQLPIDGGSLTRHQRGFTQFTRPVFPSPAAARMERAATSAFPRASHPADQEPTTHVEVGTGQRARTWNYSLNITSVDPPIGSSLTTCDLASHDESEQWTTRGARTCWLLLSTDAGVSARTQLTTARDEVRARRAAVDSRPLRVAMQEPTIRAVVHLEMGSGRSSSGGR